MRMNFFPRQDTTREPGVDVYAAGGLITLSPNKELKDGWTEGDLKYVHILSA
jgi:hypothetical protein